MEIWVREIYEMFVYKRSETIQYLKLNIRLLFKDTHRKKASSDKKSSAYEKYERGHLGSWYVKSTLYTRFLNWNKILTEKGVNGKTRICSFDESTFSHLGILFFVAVEYIELNWLCKHVKKVTSSQSFISINSCTKWIE